MLHCERQQLGHVKTSFLVSGNIGFWIVGWRLSEGYQEETKLRLRVEITDVGGGKVELQLCSGANPEFTVHPEHRPDPAVPPFPLAHPTEDLLISKHVES